MFAAPVRWLTSNEVATVIRQAKRPPPVEYAIVDVRDADYFGGNIKGSIHIPSVEFTNKVNGLVEQLKDTPLVIFHCFLSQQRGPTAAKIFRDVRDDTFGVESSDKQEVAILRGGFVEFQAQFKEDPELVENWDSTRWEELGG